jgi:hypothetical protein
VICFGSEASKVCKGVVVEEELVVIFVVVVVAITTGLVVEVEVVVLIVGLAIVVAEFKTRTGGDGLMSNESGGVTALPTLSNCPPKSNEFIEAIAS